MIDWQTYVAGIVTDTTVRDSFISALHAYASDGENNAPLSDWYDTQSGSSQGFRARPVVGGHLALVSYRQAEDTSTRTDLARAAGTPEGSGVDSRKQYNRRCIIL